MCVCAHVHWRRRSNGLDIERAAGRIAIISCERGQFTRVMA